MRPGTFASSVTDAFREPGFAARAHRIVVPATLDRAAKKGEFHPLDEWRLFNRVLRAALSHDGLLLFSSRGRLKPELLATVLIGFLPKRRRPVLVFYGEMFEPNSGRRALIEQVIMKMADRAVHRYVVYSAADRDVFPRNWGVNRDKIRVCHVFVTQASKDSAPPVKPRGQHIFAGGNSFRDYEPLLAAARQLPEHQFVICTNRLDGRKDLPPNVRAGVVPLQEYVNLIDTAAVVIVPLRLGLRRGAGKLTFLESMLKSKPTIVSDTLAVREYVRDGETGLVVDGSPEDYIRAICWTMDASNQEQVAQMGERARNAVLEHFSLARHVACLLAIMDEAMPASTESKS